MLKLIQTGKNPDWPMIVEKFWQYSESEAPPEWITDNAKITEISKDNIPLLEKRLTNTGSFYIMSPVGILVEIKTPDSWVLWDDRLGFLSMTNEQKELIYEEK